MTENTIIAYTGPWTEVQLKHLLRRTMFGVKQTDFDFFRSKSMDECVDILLSSTPMPPPPFLKPKSDEYPQGVYFTFLPENKETEDGRILYLKGWWMRQMLFQERNIREKMLLFWRNHFVTEFNMVLDSRYSYQYLDLMRRYATGNFRKLTREMTVNPCMLVYLNGNLNTKDAINENYGRELQELFMIGKGPDSHFTEADVKAAARVLSGWKDEKVAIGSSFDPAAHDAEDKLFSAFYGNHKIKGKKGKNGAEETDELIDMILKTKESSKFICRKLYRWFIDSAIDEKVEETVIAPLARIFVTSDYEIKPVLRALLSSAAFYDSYLIGGMFKSPVDYMVGLLRELNVKFYDDDTEDHYMQLWAVALTIGYMGQDIGDPPNVGGWPAYYEYPIFYKNWINSESLAFRYKMARLLSFPEESDRLLVLDFVAIVQALSDPADALAVVNDSLNLVCSKRPNAVRVTYLFNILDSENNTKAKWSALWAKYQSDPTDKAGRDDVNFRLRKIYDIIFTLPEFQIM